MKKGSILFAVLLALAVALPLAAVEGESGSWTGWISDSHCGAKGMSAEHRACAEKCFAKGSEAVFVTSDGEKVYKLDKQEEAKPHAGHEVVVTGTMEGDMIKVESIAMAEGGEEAPEGR